MVINRRISHVLVHALINLNFNIIPVNVMIMQVKEKN